MYYFRNYDAAWEYLKRGRDIAKGRPIACNTRILKREYEDYITIQYWNTYIVRYYKTKSGQQWMSFCNGGYTTPTTLSRLNQYLPGLAHVDTSYGKKIGQWYLSFNGEIFNLNHTVKICADTLRVKNKKQMSLQHYRDVSHRGGQFNRMLNASITSLERKLVKKHRELHDMNSEYLYIKNMVELEMKNRDALLDEVGYLLKLKKGNSNEGTKDVLNRV